MTSSTPATSGSHQRAGDDMVLAFRTLRSDVVGRVVRLGRVADEILTRHDYPPPVTRALGEALALTSLLGAAVKPGGKLILQTKTNGPLGFLVVNYEAPGALRGYASFDKKYLSFYGKGVSQGVLLGRGHLAMTIDPGGEAERTQGIVPVERETLAEAAHTYFRQSEQLPTFIRLAIARHYVGGSDGTGSWAWRAGGLIVQHLPPQGGAPRPLMPGETAEERDARLEGDDDENWNRVRILAETVEDHELLDPLLTPERLLLRLFHEEGVVVSPEAPLRAECRCSRERILSILGGFSSEELGDLVEPDGGMTVKCEYCNAQHRFRPEDIKR